LWRCAALVGEWLVTNNLSDTNQAERAAAMWAAANQDDFDTARAAGNARTHGPHRPIQAAVVASPILRGGRLSVSHPVRQTPLRDGLHTARR